MHYRLAALVAAPTLALGGPASAQDTSPPKTLTVSGGVGLVSDYRFRGVSQSDEGMAVQGGLTISHHSGAYAGAWASNLAGWGTFGGANLELDLIAGYKLPVGGGGTLDIGLTWYMYPGGAAKTDFAEAYARLSGTIGPATLTAGVAYAPRQQALGRWYRTGADAAAGIHTDPGDRKDNLYLWGDAALGVPGTGLTAKAHLGHARGNPGLGPNGTSVTPTGRYWDWLAGADYALKGTPLTLGIAYVDTDIGRAESAYLLPNFASAGDGGPIAGARLVFSISAAF